jgi:hypothetical protein
MTYRGILLLMTACLLHGCAAYTLVEPGTVEVGELQVRPESAWSRASAAAVPFARSGTAVWTQDGLMLNRLMIIPAVPDGEPIFKEDRQGQMALPKFRASMLPNELEELTASSLGKMFGEGSAVVQTANLRPHRYGEDRGILLDVEAAVTDGPDYKGLAGAFVANDALYLILYVAAVPYYYEKDLAEAQSIIKSAHRGTL